MLRTSIDKIKKTASSWQRKEAEGTLQKTITDANYADDIAILAKYTLIKPKLYCIVLEQPAAAIGLHVNAHKTEYMFLIKQATFPHKREPLWNW